jgi:hypothetical protein
MPFEDAVFVPQSTGPLTGHSTLRRSIAALLRYRAIPRNPGKPDPRYASMYGLRPDDDVALGNWMRMHLRLAVWTDDDQTPLLRTLEDGLNRHGYRRSTSISQRRGRTSFVASGKGWLRRLVPRRRLGRTRNTAVTAADSCVGRRSYHRNG